MTLAEALADYLLSLKGDTRRTHEPYIRRYLDFHGHDQPLSSLSGSRVETFAESQIRTSDPSAPQRVAALKAWFQYLKKKDYTEVNYGVHIRARRALGASRAAGAALRPEEQPIEMTADGMARLEDEMRELNGQKLQLAQAIELARQDGDLRENAPYHAAREALALTESRHRQISEALKRAVVVERTNDDRSGVGSTVIITNLDDDKQVHYTLVSPREANAGERKISVDSPVGRELLGKREGDEVRVTTPRGEVRYRIDAVKQG